MANSKYEYVRSFEQDVILLPNTWIVVRIDGRGFHRLSNHYEFAKPNDHQALELMNLAAGHTLRAIPDICFAYGVSDEYSFVFDRNTTLFERRRDKLISTVVSTFTSGYVALWDRTMNNCTELPSNNNPDSINGRKLDAAWLPTFDGRAICYPTTRNVRDYLSWRQVDCHINNLYNTTFWALVLKGGMTQTQAEEELKGTVAADKNEILFSRFQINYNNEPEMYRKGSCVYREYDSESSNVVGEVETKVAGNGDDGDKGDEIGGEEVSKTQMQKIKKAKQRATIVVKHTDIIKDEFWDQRPWILNGKVGRRK